MSKRIVYFDYLRVFAIMIVILLHIAASNWANVDVKSFTWQVLNITDSIARWGVPIFVMISGALFLNREISTKQIYRKYILRIVVAYLVWSTIYALFMNGGIADRIVMIVKGHYHLWFLFMIIGLYAIIPLIKPIIENDKRTKYFLILAGIFAIIIPFIGTLIGDFGGIKLNKLWTIINDTINNTNLYFVVGYTGYFVLGYYINKVNLSKKAIMIIYILGILGFIMTIGLSVLASLKTNTPCNNYYSVFSINVLLESIAVFTWFKYRKYKNNKLNNFFFKLSTYSFGAYLVHALVLEKLDDIFHLNTLSFNPILSIICILLITVLISFTISAVLNKIPKIKEFIV